MGLVGRLDRIQQRSPWLGFPIAVVYKYVDDFGNYLAALMAYYVFVALFPTLLLASTVLSWVLAGDPALQATLLQSALSEFPVVGGQLSAPQALGGGVSSVVVGIVGALYGSLGAAQAFQYAANTVWQVPRNRRPNPFASRGRSVLILSTVGLSLVLITIGAQVLNELLELRHLGRLVIVAFATLLNIGTFLLAFRLATARPQSVRTLWPGAVMAGVLYQALQNFGSNFVQHVIRNSSTSTGVFAIVLGLLAYLFLTSIVVVLAMEVNVVRRRHLWPRALLTPFTDDVNLTPGDEVSYAGQAQAARAKGFQQIDVQFGEPPGRVEKVEKVTPPKGSRSSRSRRSQ